MKQKGMRTTACLLAAAIAMESSLMTAYAVLEPETEQQHVMVSEMQTQTDNTTIPTENLSIQEQLLSGETVVSVSNYNMSAQEAEQVGKAAGIPVSCAYEEDGTVSALVAETDPATEAVVEEINGEDLSTLGSEDNMSDVAGLTTEEKQQLMAAYEEYQQYRTENVEYFGVQTPFFTTKDTDSNPIGSLLTIVGTQQDENGYYTEANGEKVYLTVDDVCEIIQMFTLSSQLAVEVLGDDLLDAREQALNQLDDSMKEEDVLLVLADWLTEQTSFDMGYLMGLEARDEEQSPYYETVYQKLEEQYDSQTAEDLADTVIDFWCATQFGALCLGECVCLGYSEAYTYLIQCAYPDIYKNEDGTWKSYRELNYRAETSFVYGDDGRLLRNEDGSPMTQTEYQYDADAGAIVDYARVTFPPNSYMYGETLDSSYSDHYWNAVKRNDSWYYVDTCYIDVYTECGNRDRAETDGQLNHAFFLFSDSSMREIYEGSNATIDTLYEDNAVDTRYEHEWFSYAKGPVTRQEGTWYYSYDSTDNMGLLTGAASVTERDYQIIRRDAEDSMTLVSFHSVSDGGCEVYNPVSGTMEPNEELTGQYEKHVLYQERYPALSISVEFYQDVLYFNVANSIFSYDLATGAVQCVKQYNRVFAKRDWSNSFGGRAFTVTNEEKEADLWVDNHPIAGMVIRSDGTMVVSVATNYALISSPGWRTMEDIAQDGHYGYEFEETNYNPDVENKGLWVTAKGKNDNSEFMWSANFVETTPMSELTGEHDYQIVSVAATCGENAFTERRCKTCGAIEPDSREEQEGTALDHHYVKSEETYYTKSGGTWNTGTAYVCSICMDACSALPDGQSAEHAYGDGTFHWNEDNTECTMEHSCSVCEGKALDCVLEDETVHQMVDCTVSVETTGSCEEGLIYRYTASAESEGRTESDIRTKETAPQEHEGVIELEEVSPTCTKAGLTERIVCSRCGVVLQEQQEIPAVGHEYKETVVRTATLSSNGLVIHKCQVCFDAQVESIPRPVSAVTRQEIYTYSGKDKSPKVTVKDNSGNTIPDTQYRLSYTNGRRNVGVHTVVITFTGERYQGTMQTKYTIRPAAVKGFSLSSKRGAIVASWKANAAQVTGYQIQYSRSRSFPARSRKNAWITGRKTVSKRLVSGLFSGKTYYVRIRSYKVVDGTKLYSKWCTEKRIVFKK